VGAYLTFPARRKSVTKHHVGWWKRWQKSWRVRWNQSTFKLNFDLHRAGGLWLWAMLFVIAWSSVAFNLNEVYSPAMKAVFKFQQADENIATLAMPLSKPAIGWEQALVRAEQLMRIETATQKFTILGPERLRYDPYRAVYKYTVKSNLDINEKVGQTAVYFDANTGKKLAVFLPSQQASGDTLNGWLTYLHTAKMWGLPYQILVLLMGLMVVILSVTGVYIWWKKHKGRFYSEKLSQEA
jgi:uncharacterized iron-regulated membrane protein